MKRGSLGFVFALFLSLPVIAQELSLKGSLIQGGLITGNTLPGAKIDLSGKKIRVNADGLFVFGFGVTHRRSGHQRSSARWAAHKPST